MRKLIIATFELEDEAINLLRQLQDENVNVKETSIIKKVNEKTVLGVVDVNPNADSMESSREDDSFDPVDHTDEVPTGVAGGYGAYIYPGVYGIGTFDYSKDVKISIAGPLYHTISKEDQKDFNKHLERRGVPSSDIDKFEQTLLKDYTVVLVETTDDESGLIAIKFRNNGAMDVKIYDQ